MAKYISNKSTKKFDVQVLNECNGQYVVRFENGIIKKVSKDRICDLDKIDEGVIDFARKFGDAAGSFGRKVSDIGRKAAEAVKRFFVKVFKINDYVFFSDKDGLIPAIHPINAMQGAKRTSCVNYIPSSATVEMCDELGIEPEAIENYEYSGEYNGSIDFTEYLGESVKLGVSLFDAMFEEKLEGNRLSKSEKISLHGDFRDATQNQIVNIIGNEYMSRYRGNNPNTLPLMIWGAPGIGKTSIIRSLETAIREKTGGDITIISINGGNVGPDDFTMPATVQRNLDDKIRNTFTSNDIDDIDKEGFKAGMVTTIKDLPKSWLPVYNPNSDEIDPKIGNAIANGGSYEKGEDGTVTIKNGPGGIFFIDEFSRLNQYGMDALMQTPVTREIGSNSTLRFGDRWVIVCAANRPSDMSSEGKLDALKFEAASKTRFNHVNFMPNPKDWIDWANRKSKHRPERSNVLPEIVRYIEEEIKNHPDNFGDFYEMWVHPGGTLNGEKGTASPRTWEAASEFLIDNILESDFGRKYNSLSEMPKKELSDMLSGIIGGPVADRFADYVAQYSLFSGKDAENVWTKGDAANYEVIKQKKLDSANTYKYFTEHITPLLKDYYPGGFEQGKPISPDAAMNFMKFLALACNTEGKFNLNLFKKLSTQFGNDFSVDLRSLSGPYADVANFKEDVIAKNELV